MIDMNAALDGRDFVRFYVNMNCLLKLMIREHKDNPGKFEGKPILAESSFEGEDLRLRIECKRRGINPFVVSMDRPWPSRVFLGRLTAEGKPRIFLNGLKIFFEQLKHEGALDAFSDNLEAALDYSLGVRRPCIQ